MEINADDGSQFGDGSFVISAVRETFGFCIPQRALGGDQVRETAFPVFVAAAAGRDRLPRQRQDLIAVHREMVMEGFDFGERIPHPAQRLGA